MAEPSPRPLQPPAEPADELQPQVGVSRWAIFALGTSLAFFCPLMMIVGPMLGLRALIQIRANPGRTGRGMALAAIWIGLAGCVGWIALLFWWNTNVRGELLTGPQTALRLAIARDEAKFRDCFVGEGANAPIARIDEFTRILRERYGLFQSARQDDQAPPPRQSGGRDVVIPYVLEFDRGPVKGQAEILLFASWLAPKLKAITIKDAVRGDVTFP